MVRRPGSTILVLPGTYHEPGTTHAVTVTRDDIRLVAHPRPSACPSSLRRTAARQTAYGFRPRTPSTPTRTTPARRHERRAVIELRACRGFTVRGFSRFGVYLACVTGFRISDMLSTDNGEYAIFPVASGSRSAHAQPGYAGGASDACLYIGEDDKCRR